MNDFFISTATRIINLELEIEALKNEIENLKQIVIELAEQKEMEEE